MPHKQSLGRLGEKLAAEYLGNHGFSIVEQNARTPAGEIDIICQKGNLYVFVEVKTRIGDSRGAPWEAVGWHKRVHLRRAIHFWITVRGLGDQEFRVDVASVLLNADRSLKHLRLFSNVELASES